MSLLATKSPILVTAKSLGALYAFIAFCLFFDSYYIAPRTSYAQFYATLILTSGFFFTFYKVNKRVKEQMITAVLIAIIGEYLFSIALGMYTYRLNNVPHYVPPGHALMYVGVLYFSKAAAIKKHKVFLEKFLAIFIFTYATAFLVFGNDIFGFIMTVTTLLILRKKPRERLFYLTMYISVAYLEIIGTNYLCWEWPSTAYGIFDFLPSYNPPSGISLFYFLLDLGTLWFYKQRHKIAWNRMKLIRKNKKPNY